MPPSRYRRSRAGWRPSISWRSSMNTSSPSFIKAMAGDDGGYPVKYSRAPFGRLEILSSEDGYENVGLGFVAQRSRYPRPHASGRTTADRVDGHDRRAALRPQDLVYLVGGCELLEAQLHQLVSHAGRSAPLDMASCTPVVAEFSPRSRARRLAGPKIQGSQNISVPDPRIQNNKAPLEPP